MKYKMVPHLTERILLVFWSGKISDFHYSGQLQVSLELVDPILVLTLQGS